MKDRDEIKELFSDTLGGYEAKVDPKLWGKIASQVGSAAATSTSVGVSLITKTIIGISIASVVVVSAIIYNNLNTDERSQTENPSVELLSENTTETGAELETIQDEQKENKPEITDQNSFQEEKAVLMTPVDNSTPYMVSNEEENILSAEEEIVVDQVVKEEVQEKEKVVQDEEEEEMVEIKIEDEASLTPSYVLEALPNVFSPNGDNVNDILSIKSEGLMDFNIVVLDESYKTVFQSTDPNFTWDGNDPSGMPLSSEKRYVYYLTAIDKNGNSVNKSSSLKIVR